MRAWPALAVTALVLFVPASASAGRLIVTGHDADRRCAQLDQQCGFVKAALRYVRESAPRPRAPILVLDRGPRQLAAAIRRAWAPDAYAGALGARAGTPRLRVVDPRSRAFARLRISVRRFSAVAIASDSSCGGCDLEVADARAVVRRRRAVQRFLNGGGGIYAGAGGSDAAYYRFMPLPRSGPASAGPFELTPYGRRIGFTTADVTCCAAANTFGTPAVGRLAVAAQTSAAKTADTLIADGVVRRGRLVATTTIPAVTGKSFVVQPVSGTVLGHPPGDPRFRRITGAANLVMGWTLDVTKGRARLTTQDGRRQQSVDAYEGFFTILQAGSSPVTDLALRSGDFDAVCGYGGVDVARATSKSVRHLWASGKGKFRTRGRFAVAAIRGTEWETDDRCDGTLISVRAGAVSVFDETLQKTVVVTAGHSYLAKAP